VATILSRHAPIPIRYEAETEAEAYASRAHFGAPDFEVEGWVTSYTAIAAGEMASLSDDVERVTGRPPTSFERFLEQEPPAWPQLTASP
jgi:NAD(P)H dehydrogenase (quinone)